jgi:polar amino acid transport system permease protein
LSFDVTPILASWRFIAAGLQVTLLVSALSILVGLGVGLALGVLRTFGGRVADLTVGFYVDTVRAVPVLVILVWIYFAFPLLIGRSLDPIAAAVIGFGLHMGAYAGEVVRAGLGSIRPGQSRAGLALGMSRLQVIRTIVLPQALIRMIPAFGSLIVIVVKDSSIASVIAVPELMRQSQVLAQWSFHPFELYTLAMLVYFVLCYPLARGVDAIYRRLAPLGAS